MKWNILNKTQRPDEIIEGLLVNRGLKTKKEIDDFLSPVDPGFLTPTDVGIDKKQLAKAIKRIENAVKEEEPIVVYGDYDADGICSAAILWESLRDLGAKVLPFIPQREKEGYGLSKEGIDTILADSKYAETGLIISADSGIVANEAVDYANSKGIHVVILDHHEKGESDPKAHAIIHTQTLCAAAISYIFANELLRANSYKLTAALELAAIATVTDLMPLLGPNRSIVKFGLEKLNTTTRPGLRALFSVAGIEKVGTYEVGYMIGPRLNASGRIENALLALRMLCTSDFSKALQYAQELNETNKQRQGMTEEMTLHALGVLETRTQLARRSSKSEGGKPETDERIIVIEHESYHQGIIGLIAGKLVDKYYLPAIVIAKGEEVSKASARSISGFNIIEAIRGSSAILLGAGGHPMAAGFSIETSRIAEFKEQISKLALEQITDDLLDRVLRVDCNLPLDQIDMAFYQKLAQFEPFGLGNPEPTFATEVAVQTIRTVGQEGKHLKMSVTGHSSLVTRANPQVTSDQFTNLEFDCIAFGKGALCKQINVGDKISLAYTVDLNTFNGRQSLQLKIKDIKYGGTNQKDPAL